MNEKYYKQDEIYEYILQELCKKIENDETKNHPYHPLTLKENILINFYYNLINPNFGFYVKGKVQAKIWLGDQGLEVIETVKDFEERYNEEFGNTGHTDFSDFEQVINQYVYYVADYIFETLPKHKNGDLDKEAILKLKYDSEYVEQVALKKARNREKHLKKKKNTEPSR